MTTWLRLGGCKYISCVLLSFFTQCICAFANDSVGVLALSHYLGGYDCFALLDTRFDSLVRKLSVVGVHNMAHVAAYPFITHSPAHSLLSTSEGC